ncbi:hypothetical protein AAF712_009217 [Marasmius tenuissimus]|uniref:Uncharacterized protein n=1 Tax=Marasmius tenuissimus TaxID=585030 RepID=A0ABR2ZSN0_9AGAR
MKAMQDKNNVDVFVSSAFLAPDYQNAIETLDEGKRRGRVYLERKFGPDALNGNGPLMGEFYSIIETRPYMRVMQAYVRMNVEFKKYAKAVDAVVEMFRLNPNDPMRQHTWLGSLLCQVERYSDALYFAQFFMDIRVGRIDKGDLPAGGGTNFLPPRNDLYSPEEQEKLSEFFEATILYTAALASFKMWGDTEQARMYLRLAAGQNPKVLVKLLGRVRRPEGLNTAPRTFNSSEDAHDYLWLSQNLWMDDGVWYWISENPDARKSVLLDDARGVYRPPIVAVNAKNQTGSGIRRVHHFSIRTLLPAWLTRFLTDCERIRSFKAIARAVATGKPLPADSNTPVYVADSSEHGIYTQEIPKTNEGSKKKKKKKKNKSATKSGEGDVGQKGDQNGSDDGEGEELGNAVARLQLGI